MIDLKKKSLLTLNNINQINYNNVFTKEIYLLKKILFNIFKKLQIFLLSIYIDISKNKISYNLYLYISSKKLISLKKCKNTNQKVKIYKNINKLLFRKLNNLNINLISIKIKILNKEVNKNALHFLFNLLKKFSTSIFEKRFNLFIDFLKFCILLNSSKVTTKNFLQILSQVFKNLHKKKHSRFIMLLKVLLEFLIKNNFENKILGIKIVLSGKLKGKTMASSIKLLKGKVSNSFNNFLDYSQTDIFTKYGVFGLKCWILRS